MNKFGIIICLKIQNYKKSTKQSSVTHESYENSNISKHHDIWFKFLSIIGSYLVGVIVFEKIKNLLIL